MKRKILYFFIFLAFFLYVLFYKKISKNWNYFESFTTLILYIIAVLQAAYLLDIKFYFFIQRVISFFKYDIVTFNLSSRYKIQYDFLNNNILDKIFNFCIVNNCKLEKRSNTFLKVLWNDKNLFNFRTTHIEDCEFEIIFYTSKIDVSVKKNKKIIDELTTFIENIENIINPEEKSKSYDLDIEYQEKSPFYSYWIRNLPEQKVFDFNCSLETPYNNDSTIRVNKNHVIVKSHQLFKLFEVAKNYLSLRGTN